MLAQPGRTGGRNQATTSKHAGTQAGVPGNWTPVTDSRVVVSGQAGVESCRKRHKRVVPPPRGLEPYALRGAEIAMYNETNVPGPEYRVRTVVRYVVTRYCHPYIHRAEGPLMDQEIPGGSTLVGEFQNLQQAYEVAKALAVSESPAEATVSV